MSNLNDFFGGGELKWWDEIYDNKIEITASQDWTVPAGVDEVVVGICGGGGAGDDSAYGAGGGGSKMTYHKLSVTSGETITVTIGAGGVYPSGDGGSSSFGTYVTVEGGQGCEDNIKFGYGGNGGSPGGYCYGDKTHSYDLTVEKIENGMVISKQLYQVVSQDKSGAGGCGGGYDYPGIGGNKIYTPTGYGAGGAQSGGATNGSGTSGICVIWY